ncbi:GNAT family N-acetyltransferase [Oceanibacterium hippocampi]|uniref:Acetyltransferase n=1 Tax=Oceanibacterium hippocampi TaxID=745714 RepID=A0A1Y5SH14_9PROT|nr:GNAT family N-acetyltransferase [Oceanibacterium hippocampi]SLN40614.1 Acetyltransferase [Oceanibacterium hippocampi]
MDSVTVFQVAADRIETHFDDLAAIIRESVGGGGAIGFLQPFTADDADRFWRRTIRPEIASGQRILFAAARNGPIVGTVQLVVGMPPNQPHRCEIAKMAVRPAARRQGIARALLAAAERQARALGRTLVTLDTRTGDSAEALYASMGFERAGIIPDYALDPDGAARHATTCMFKRL